MLNKYDTSSLTSQKIFSYVVRFIFFTPFLLLLFIRTQDIQLFDSGTIQTFASIAVWFPMLIFPLIGLIFTGVIVNTILEKRMRNKRRQEYTLYAQQYPNRKDAYRKLLGPTMQSTTARNAQIQTLHTAGWSIADLLLFDVNSKGKKTNRAFYTSVVFPLKGAVPNIFFDSKHVQGKQIAAFIDDDQRHSLEGTFDSHFDTYFPIKHQNDALALITPDVMQALVAANNYDIEFFDTFVALYAVPEANKQQLHVMAKHAYDIAQAISSNSAAYDDHRIAGSNETINAHGQKLLKNANRHYAQLAVSVLLIIIGLVMIAAFPGGAIHGLILVGASGAKIFSEIDDIRKLRSFKKSYKNIST